MTQSCLQSYLSDAGLASDVAETLAEVPLMRSNRLLAESRNFAGEGISKRRKAG